MKKLLLRVLDKDILIYHDEHELTLRMLAEKRDEKVVTKRKLHGPAPTQSRHRVRPSQDASAQSTTKKEFWSGAVDKSKHAPRTPPGPLPPAAKRQHRTCAAVDRAPPPRPTVTSPKVHLKPAPTAPASSKSCASVHASVAKAPSVPTIALGSCRTRDVAMLLRSVASLIEPPEVAPVVIYREDLD